MRWLERASERDADALRLLTALRALPSPPEKHGPQEETPEEDDLPFLTPRVYAQVMDGGESSIDTQQIEDYSRLHTEVSKPNLDRATKHTATVKRKKDNVKPRYVSQAVLIGRPL